MAPPVTAVTTLDGDPAVVTTFVGLDAETRYDCACAALWAHLAAGSLPGYLGHVTSYGHTVSSHVTRFASAGEALDAERMISARLADALCGGRRG